MHSIVKRCPDKYCSQSLHTTWLHFKVRLTSDNETLAQMSRLNGLAQEEEEMMLSNIFEQVQICYRPSPNTRKAGNEFRGFLVDLYHV
jgi:hypothetical protein